MRNIPQHDVRAVANYFIQQAKVYSRLSGSFKPEPMTLQAMVYMTHIAYALCYNAMFCSEDFEQGDTAPYFPTLREALKFCPNDELPNLIEDCEPREQFLGINTEERTVLTSNFTPDQTRFLNQIWEFCSKQNVDFSLGERLSEKPSCSAGFTPMTTVALDTSTKVREQFKQLQHAFSAA